MRFVVVALAASLVAYLARIVWQWGYLRGRLDELLNKPER